MGGSTPRAIGPFLMASRDSLRPTISRVRPVFGSTAREMTSTVAATVRDRRTNLAKGGDRRCVDGGQQNTSSYSSATDRLNYRSGRLYDDRHAVKIVAPEASGNRVDECWNGVSDPDVPRAGPPERTGICHGPSSCPPRACRMAYETKGTAGDVW
ncbi:MAG TPA: hypothetical protein VE568_09435 [Rubrobacter sp.]|nr:hypothetical protein [Rubrobacter sp.]